MKFFKFIGKIYWSGRVIIWYVVIIYVYECIYCINEFSFVNEIFICIKILRNYEGKLLFRSKI